MSKAIISVNRFFIAAVLVSLAVTVLHAQKYSGWPVTKDRLVKAVKSKQFAVPTLVRQISKNGVDFELTLSVEGELRSARAHEDIINAVRTNYRYAGAGRGTATNRPAQTERDTAGEQYDQLYYQGLSTLTQVRTATSVAQAQSIVRSVIDTGSQAIKLIPTRPEAYTLVCAAHLFTRNFPEAERYAQIAIDRGGDVAIPVYHLAGTPHLELLHIGTGFVTVESEQKFFQFNSGEISNPQEEDDYVIGAISVAVFSISTNKNGRSDLWYFSPGVTGTTQEAQMMLRLIRKNSIGR